MEGFENNGACVAAYLAMVQAMQGEGAAPREQWAEIQERETRTGGNVLLAPPILRERFGLEEWEFLCVMAALALEMDGGMRTRARNACGLELPTVEYGLHLTASICPTPVETLAELAGSSVLCPLLLTTAAGGFYPLERPLILCRAALAFLTGPAFAYVPGMNVLQAQSGDLPLHQQAYAQIQSWYAAGAETPLRLCGPRGSGRRTLLCEACGGAAAVDLSALESMSAADRDHVFREAAVTARLLGIPLCALHGEEHVQTLKELRRSCARFAIPLAVMWEDESTPWEQEETVRLAPRLTRQERQTAWRHFVPQARPDTCPEGGMTVGTVRETARLALRYAADEGRETVCPADVGKALRRRGGAWSEGLRYDVTVSLRDLVLPKRVAEQLRLICHQARVGGTLEEWGLPQYREGVTAVFHGPSGTGKTMAAQAIAGELGLPLFRADLSQIMDKYVGETEKHLARLLACARENRCVLLFDEADALFGRRGEISSGHDRYANLSTAYLLQEMERYEGVALLSTNLLSNFDEAFLRRLHFIIRFPLPEEELRETLWKKALPRERLEGEIPYAMLARAPLSPARINAAVRVAAASAAAQGRERVSAGELVRALRLELEKNGKTLPSALAELETDH